MINAPDTPQLLLSIEPAPTPDRQFVLRVNHSEQDYFTDQTRRGPGGYPIEIPRPLQDTALMDDGRWRCKLRDFASCRHLGMRVWSGLPPQVTQEILSGTPAAPRRVAVVSAANGVDGVPWEWINDGQTLLAASPAVRFVRLVPCRYVTPPLTVTGPLRILAVTTNPKDERLLNPWVERDVIVGSLRGRQAEYELRELMEPGIEAFAAALRWSPHIVHYVGHSGITAQNGAIILHDDSGGTRWVTATELSRLLPSCVRLLCLSTCVTQVNYDVSGLARIAHLPAEQALPTCIVNQYAITQAAGSAFWSAFYQALIAHHGEAVEAFHDARMAAVAQSNDDGNDNNKDWSWASFSMVVRNGSVPLLRLGAAAAGASASANVDSAKRFASEVQAEWSARLANALASRVKPDAPGGQHALDELIGSEESRIRFLADEIEKS